MRKVVVCRWHVLLGQTKLKLSISAVLAPFVSLIRPSRSTCQARAAIPEPQNLTSGFPNK